jgi:hypothetical protein
MHYVLKLLFILSIQLPVIASMAATAETDQQRIVREVYATLNGANYQFAAPDEGGHPTSLPTVVFEKKINPTTKAPSFYSRDGVPPADAIRRLREPGEGEVYFIECSIAASICKNALFINAFESEENFNLFSQNASELWKAMRPTEPAHQFLSNILLGNRMYRDEEFANDLLSGSVRIDTFDESTLLTGDILSISNDSLYYDRHPYGKFGAENVIFYGLNESREPLFCGFKGIFEDGKPHTLNEIQIAMLDDFLAEPTEFENRYHHFHPLSTDKSNAIMSRIKLIARLGSARLAGNICAPKIRVTLATKNIELIKSKLAEMHLS